MRIKIFFLSAFLGLVATGCPSRTLLTIKQQTSIRQQYRGSVFYLKYSCYVTPFWSYDDRLYLTERQLDERVLITTAGGDPILPGKPLAIVPMGTKVRIKKIEFPTSQAMSDRKLNSPRHFTWVFVEAFTKREGVTQDKPYVLVLTQQMRSSSMFAKTLQLSLLKDDPRVEFSDRPHELLQAIDKKKVITGMRYDALLRSRGQPGKVIRKVKDGVRWERWIYAPDRQVVLKDDRVVRWTGLE